MKTETFGSDQITDFVMGLTEAVAELRDAYPALLTRIRGGLQDAFELKGDFEKFRKLMGVVKGSGTIRLRAIGRRSWN